MTSNQGNDDVVFEDTDSDDVPGEPDGDEPASQGDVAIDGSRDEDPLESGSDEEHREEGEGDESHVGALGDAAPEGGAEAIVPPPPPLTAERSEGDTAAHLDDNDGGLDALSSALEGENGVPTGEPGETVDDALGSVLDRRADQGRAPAEERAGGRGQEEAAAAEAVEDEEHEDPAPEETEVA